MDRLPTEILHNIFIQLEFKDRIPCTLACRSWFNTLDKYSLLYSVDMCCSQTHFKRFMDMLDQLPHRATQVEELVLRKWHWAQFDKRKILNAFPNVRVLKVDDDTLFALAERYFSTPIEIKRSKSKIKILYDSVHCEIASQIMTSNLGGSLEELDLNFCSTSNTRFRTILNQLRNLPVLTKLTLNRISLEINDLEIIHANLPSIQEFYLIAIKIADSIMPANISPVTSLTSFDMLISSSVGVEAHSRFYQYMTKKYCSVANIESHDDMILKLNTNNRQRIYSNGLLDFYKIVVPTKKTFDINSVPLGVNIFDLFDEINCQLEEISIYNCRGEILEHLTQSNQAKYIQRLSIDRTDIRPIHCIKTMTALTTLQVKYHSNHHPSSINISDCLNACPITLKQLTLDYRRSVIDVSSIHLSFIESLEIRSKYIDNRIAAIVSSSFPKLVKLKLNGRLSHSIHLTLHNPMFQEANFALAWIKPHGVTFKALNQIAPQHYIVVDDDCHLVMYEKICNLPVLNVTCFTEKIVDYSHNSQTLSICTPWKA